MKLENIESIRPAHSWQLATLGTAEGSSVSPGTCVQLWCRVDCTPDPARLKNAWGDLVRYNPALRSSFVWRRVEKPMQIIHRESPACMEYFDWQSLTKDKQTLAFQELVASERRKGFDPASLPLVRLSVCQVDKASFHLVMSAHPAALDVSGLELLMEEILGPTEQKRKRNDAQAQRMQAIVQRDWGGAEDAVGYWAKVIANTRATWLSPANEIGGQRTRVSGDKSDPAEETRILPDVLAGRLQARSTELDCEPYALVAFAWALVLSKYTRDSDIALGVIWPMPAGIEDATQHGFRPREAVLPWRFSNLPALRIRDLLKKWLEQKAQFDRHARYALDNWLWWERSDDIYRFACSCVRPNEPGSGLTSYAADIHFYEAGATPLILLPVFDRGASLSILYDQGCFAQEEISQALQHLQTALVQVVADPDALLADVALLTKDQQRNILSTWNPHSVVFKPKSTDIISLFERSAARSAENIAVEDGRQKITYQELNESANRLAFYLRDRGIRPDDRVAVCLPRSVEALVAILGVLKAGAAYVPLDPSYPAERLAFQYSDSRSRILVSESGLAHTIPAQPEQFVFLDLNRTEIMGARGANPDPLSGLDNIAYVAYTSGSTGVPKGVAISRRSLAEYAETFADGINLQSSDRVLQFAPLGFDVSVEEIFPSWIAGAAVVVPREGHLFASQDFQEIVELCRITVAELPTMYWKVWLDFLVETAAAPPRSLRMVLIGGEKLAWTFAEQWIDQYTPRLLNVYGLTEATVTSAFQDLTSARALPRYSSAIPIGSPMANSRIYLVDEFLHPVPIGIAGEICIGGSGIAREYDGDAALTARRFIPDPFSGISGARLYKTGDWARHRPDGSLEFIGRGDEQVKLRGYRVELAEIETVLALHPAVAQCKVNVTRQQDAAALVAYWMPAPGCDDVQERELRKWLQTRLPEYMVPGVYTRVVSFPLTANGKIDVRALSSGASTMEAFVPPRNNLEQLVAKIFANALSMPRVSIMTSFLELGGNSLLAIKIISRLREDLGVNVPVRALFESPTVAACAERIAAEMAKRIDSCFE